MLLLQIKKACLSLMLISFASNHLIQAMEDSLFDTSKVMDAQYEASLQVQKNMVDSQLTETMLNSKNFPTNLKKIIKLLPNIKENKNYLPLAILLQGKPGVGKSTLAKGIAVRSKIVFIFIDCPLLANTYKNSGSKKLQKKIKPVFVNNDKPYIIILDEMGSVMNTTDTSNNHNQDIPYAILSLFDKAKAENKHSFIIGTTNSYEKFPEAIKSRFEDNIEIPYPLLEDRENILTYHLNKLGIDFDNSLIVLMGRNTHNFSGRDLEHLARKTAREAAIESKEHSKTLSLTKDIFNNALQEVKNDPFFVSLHPSWLTRIKTVIIKNAQYILPILSFGLSLWSSYNQCTQFNQQYALSQHGHTLAQEGLQISKDSLEVAKKSMQVAAESPIMSLLLTSGFSSRDSERLKKHFNPNWPTYDALTMMYSREKDI